MHLITVVQKQQRTDLHRLNLHAPCHGFQSIVHGNDQTSEKDNRQGRYGDEDIIHQSDPHAHSSPGFNYWYSQILKQNQKNDDSKKKSFQNK